MAFTTENTATLYRNVKSDATRPLLLAKSILVHYSPAIRSGCIIVNPSKGQDVKH